MSSPIRLVIHGAAGRMGQRLIALGSQDTRFALVGAVEHAGHVRIGDDAGTVAGVEPLRVVISAELPTAADVCIDFSTPEGAERAVEQALERRMPLVMATTNLSETTKQRLRELASAVPVCWAPSMSLAVNLTMKLAQICAATLADHRTGTDVEIIERHHRFKEDAPSGTALKFGEIIAKQMGLQQQAHGRQGQTGIRPRDEIGYHAVRVGDNPGEHTIIFGMLGETIELRVAASNRDCYAEGALRAAQFLVGKPAGLYTMEQVLGLA
ncbi:MAG: 4-hydroxy-tetrahydrodipicolinate reductase [Pirellulaceae bacterium]|nr:4-hydroxy-tetrahydrodipicolinate reductase [Planctomycetales bacterium]